VSEKYAYGGRQKALRDYFATHPLATNNEVLAALPGINLRNIAHVRKAYGYPAIAIPSAVGDANRNWLMEESARLGVGPWALVNALVTDARLDWEECEKKSNDSA
jgi:hypothetical protein